VSGGEPLLHPYLVNIVSFLKDQGFYISLNTNGSNLTKLKKCSPFIDEIKLHLEDVIPSEYQRLMNLYPSNLDKFSEVQGNICVNAISRSLEQVERLILYCSGRGLNLKLLELLGPESPLSLEVLLSYLIDKNYKIRDYSQFKVLLIKGNHTIELRKCKGEGEFRIDSKGRLLPSSISLLDIVNRKDFIEFNRVCLDYLKYRSEDIGVNYG
jgi:MoaA/NifB/PqqE/SkfB family radical SAM enzyme